MDSTAITAVFAGLVALIVALTGTFTVWNGRSIHTELKTINSLKTGQLLDATETRRIDAIPHDERTEQEQDHLDASPALGPAQGPSPTTAEHIKAISEAVNGKPADQPNLYDIAATIDMKVDANHATLMERLERLERLIGGATTGEL